MHIQLKTEQKPPIGMPPAHYLYLIKQAHLVVDLHEARGYRKMNRNSKGSGIYANGYGMSSTIVQEMVRNVNKIIDNEQHHFVTEEIALIQGSLRGYCTRTRTAIYFETGIHDMEPLKLRLVKLDNRTLFSFILSEAVNDLL